ncbi:hypothetical protein ODQ70_20635 [Escherichia coli]|nr:hypothetical protein [Escherichia coli]HDQ2022808.1 hypothetical protein [Escherichia coli]
MTEFFQLLNAFLNAPVVSQILAIVFIVVLVWFLKSVRNGGVRWLI